MHEVDVVGTATKQGRDSKGGASPAGGSKEPGPYRRPAIGKTRTLMSNERRVGGTIRSGQAGDITETCDAGYRGRAMDANSSERRVLMC